MSVEHTLQAMGLTLPEPARPLASYVPATRTGNLIMTSGQLPTVDGELRIRGKVDADLDEDTAYDAARTACLNALAAVKSVIGDLDQIRSVVRVTGYVNSSLGFTNHSAVVNGASDLLVKVFGDSGRHARSAVGVAALPLNAPVEIELVVEVEG